MMELGVINRDPIVSTARGRLLELRELQVELGQKYLAKHPRMLEIAAQISQAEQELQRAADVAWQSIEAEARALQTQHDNLSTRIVEEEQRLAAYRRDLSKLSALEQESQSRERLLEQLLTRLGEEEVASRLEGGQVTVIDPARAGIEPVNIRRSLFAAASLMAGVMAGLAVVLLVEFRDRRVRGMAGVAEATRLPVLSRIPECSDLSPLGTAGDPRHPVALADAIRVLRAALGLQSGTTGRLVITSSSRSGEGKSTLTARLAVSAAAAGLKTLLIDADLRKPTQHNQFGIEVQSGLSDVLSAGAEVALHQTTYGSLEVLAAGKPEKMNPEALSSPQLRGLIAGWRERYDLILIDTPPLGVVADALPLCEMADQIILVVRDQLVTKDALANVQSRLRPYRDSLAGIVMNGEKKQSMDSYGYGYGYGYGLEDEPQA
jgi:capsular exopolysaccharide synthesis family protein